MDAAALDHLQVGHSDTMHTESWRIGEVARIEQSLEGCAAHGRID